MDLSRLTERERDELRALHAAWVAARAAKDYAVADRHRAELERAGCLPPDYARWHPVFEHRTHRLARAAGSNNP